MKVTAVHLSLLFICWYTPLSTACFVSLQGVFLQNHVISRAVIKDVASCYYVCKEMDVCQSLNYHTKARICEVNNRTATLRASHLKYLPSTMYFENPDRVLLGTSFHLPALSCDEIKSDSKGTPASQYYWITGVASSVPHLTQCNFTTPISYCSSKPCLNGATCLEKKDTFHCSCTSAYTGRTCETSLDPCMSRPCLNGGTCSTWKGRFLCSCTLAFTGVRCETPSRK